MRILLLSNDTEIINTVRKYTDNSGDSLETASDIKQAARIIGSGEYDAVLMDCSIHAAELIGFASDNNKKLFETVVLLIGPLDTGQREKLGQRLSAHYSIDKPLRGKLFADIMRRIEMRSKIVRNAGLIGRSAAMEETIQTIMQIGATPISVLITGESGTGKEVIARAIHSVSLRADKPFLAVNCAALAEGVLESELFGHEKGAFTGAVSRRIGMFEKAHGGTIFLDEIGEIPHSTQIRLLRVLEEREIMRVGGTDIIPVNGRVIASTNRNLSELVENGTFRRDLYYRIKVLEIKAPPLREHPEDIPLLVDRISRQFAKDNNLPLRQFDETAREYLSRMHWSGNVRELRNFVESCLALTDAKVIGIKDIPQYLLNELSSPTNLPMKPEITPDRFEREIIYRTLIDLKDDIAEIKDLLAKGTIPQVIDKSREIQIDQSLYQTSDTLEDMERQAISDALKQTAGNRRKTAKLLGIGERTLYRKLKQYGLN